MFKSGYKYKYFGLNQEKTFNKLSLKYEFFNIKKYSKSEGEFSVGLKCKKLEKDLLENNIKIQEKKGFGVFFHLLKFVKRYGIISAIIISAMFFIIVSNYVFKIEIIGNETLSKNDIVEILKANNISGLISKQDINCELVEKIIIENVEDVSMVSAIVKGNSLIISIKEKVLNEEYENVESFQSIKSEYDCVITDIKLIQGTVNVKVGDVVRVGQELVLPYIVDSSGNQRKVMPKAEIYAMVYVKEQASFYDFEIVEKMTGKVEEKINLYVFGFNIFSKGQEVSFENYKTKTETKLLSKNNIIPIYRQTIYYYETEVVKIQNDFELKKNEILQNLKQKTLENLQEYDIIENERQNIVSCAGKHTVQYVLELKKRIC